MKKAALKNLKHKMRSDKWQEIEAARELLQLGDEAPSQIDIKEGL